jgi:hypothetical protein
VGLTKIHQIMIYTIECKIGMPNRSKGLPRVKINHKTRDTTREAAE